LSPYIAATRPDSPYRHWSDSRDFRETCQKQQQRRAALYRTASETCDRDCHARERYAQHPRPREFLAMKEVILLLDDDLTTLTVLERALSGAGFNCCVSSDPKQALSIVGSRSEIAVVVTDLYMPHMSGLQFAQALSETPLGRPTPRILLLTAQPSLESAIGALRGGACDFLVKPISTEDLIAAVTRALDRARQDRLIHRGRVPEMPKPQQPVQPGSLESTGRRPKVPVLDTIEKLRRLRSRYDSHKLDDVAWELLLELLRTEQGEHKLSVSALTISIPGVSATTSLRRIGELTTRGYVDRVPDARDGRRDFVALTSKAHDLLKEYLADVDRYLTDIQSSGATPSA
jgi:CheY-like chemotaxis protein/DNA-binding MarR family transcriptional regulator